MAKVWMFLTVSVLFLGCSPNFMAGIQRASGHRETENKAAAPMKDLDISQEIVSTSPPAGDSTVLLTAKIYAFFTEKEAMMEPTADTVFVVRDQWGNIVEGRASFGKRVAAFFPPDGTLKPGVNYKVTVMNLRYRNGARLIGAKSWVFTTAK